jgi:hypothetical protein
MSVGILAIGALAAVVVLVGVGVVIWLLLRNRGDDL